MTRSRKSRLNIEMVVTVGGSLVNNLSNALKEASVYRKMRGVENIVDWLNLGQEINADEVDKLIQLIRPFLIYGQRYQKKGKAFWRLSKTKKRNIQASAELQSIGQYLEKHKDEIEFIRIHLLATDTPLSSIAGQVIAQYLKEWYGEWLSKDQVSVTRIPKLMLVDLEMSDGKGLNNLLHEIYRIHQRRESDARLLINMTGGFKGVTPILCLAAQLLGGELLYSYEYEVLPSQNLTWATGEENINPGPLWSIPALDIHFFWDFMEACRPLLDRLQAWKGDTEVGLSEEEKRGLEQNLVPTGICSPLADQYRPTALGKILIDLVEQKTPVGKSVLGYMMAFKVYEYLQEETWSGYTRVRAGYYFPSSGKADRADFWYQDVDVLLGDTAKEWIWVEVKSYAKICFAYDRSNKKRYRVQLKNQMLAWQHRGIGAPKAYHLYIYRHAFHSLDRQYMIVNLQKIKDFLQKNGIEEFRVFYFTLDLNASDWFAQRLNPYTVKIASRKLTRDRSKYRQQLQSDNHFNQYLLVEEYAIPIRKN